MTDVPLLVASDLRVDVDGAPACDGLALGTTGQRVLVLGAPSAVYEAAIGVRPIARGSIELRGLAPGEAARRGIVAGAEAAPIPPAWTPREYVEWSARLAGAGAADARAAAARALAELELGALATTRANKLAVHAARATVVAAALATHAEVIVLDDPLGGLPDDVSEVFATLLAAALVKRPFLLFAPRIALASPLAAAADEAIVVRSASVLGQGAPAAIAGAERRLSLRVLAEAAALDEVARGLAARGGTLEQDGGRLLVDLGPDATSRELVALCAAAGVSVVELVPLARAFA